MARNSASSRPPTPNPPSALHCCPSCSLNATITRIADIERRTSPPPRIWPIGLASLRTFFQPVQIIPTKVKKLNLYARTRISALLSQEFLLAVRSHPRSSIFSAKVKLSPSFDFTAVACNPERYRAKKDHGRAIDPFPLNWKRTLSRKAVGIHGNAHGSQLVDKNDFGGSVR